ncbi:hypothetical protein [Kamptonema formosum]|nr:hypothetical protein [Oscillatoria sp. PCC 10802]
MSTTGNGSDSHSNCQSDESFESFGGAGGGATVGVRALNACAERVP